MNTAQESSRERHLKRMQDARAYEELRRELERERQQKFEQNQRAAWEVFKMLEDGV